MLRHEKERWDCYNGLPKKTGVSHVNVQVQIAPTNPICWQNYHLTLICVRVFHTSSRGQPLCCVNSHF